MRPDQRCECSLVFCCQAAKPIRLGQNALDHERIDINQAGPWQVCLEATFEIQNELT